MSEPAVEIVDLVKHYGTGRHSRVAAVDGLSLHAGRGEVTALLGPNGAGKTTTVEICCGLRDPDQGEVSVLGLPPARPELRARVGAMPQGGATAAGVTGATRVGEALQLFAAFYAEPLPVMPLLERLGLARLVGSPWRRLSGGEQQRLSLALAIVGRPELVFLDEPTAGLDVQGRQAVHEVIRELRAAGVTVVLTTHLLDEAELLADEVVIVDAGRAVASGSPAELTTADEDRLTFHGPTRLALESLLTALPAGSTATEQGPGRYVVTGPIDPAFLATVTAWCAGHGVMPRRLSTGGRSLEDVFLDVTGKALRP